MLLLVFQKCILFIDFPSTNICIFHHTPNNTPACRTYLLPPHILSHTFQHASSRSLSWWPNFVAQHFCCLACTLNYNFSAAKVCCGSFCSMLRLLLFVNFVLLSTYKLLCHRHTHCSPCSPCHLSPWGSVPLPNSLVFQVFPLTNCLQQQHYSDNIFDPVKLICISRKLTATWHAAALQRCVLCGEWNAHIDFVEWMHATSSHHQHQTEHQLSMKLSLTSLLLLVVIFFLLSQLLSHIQRCIMNMEACAALNCIVSLTLMWMCGCLCVWGAAVRFYWNWLQQQPSSYKQPYICMHSHFVIYNITIVTWLSCHTLLACHTGASASKTKADFWFWLHLSIKLKWELLCNTWHIVSGL